MSDQTPAAPAATSTVSMTQAGTPQVTTQVQGTAPTAAVPNPAQGQTTDWAAGLPEDVKGYVQNKGFRNPGDVLESYRNLEKHMGTPADRLLRLPDKPDDKAGWDQIYNRLGRPSDAKDYKINATEKGFEEWAKGTFHETGLTQGQAEALTNKYNEFLGKQSTAAQEQALQKHDADDKALRKEWGAAYDSNIQQAKMAAQRFGVSAEQIDSLEKSMGYAGVIKFMQSVGTKIGEGSFVTSNVTGPNFGVLSPAAAASRIESLKHDKSWTSRYIAGDVQARDEMLRLQQMALAGQDQ